MSKTNSASFVLPMSSSIHASNMSLTVDYHETGASQDDITAADVLLHFLNQKTIDYDEEDDSIMSSTASIGTKEMATDHIGENSKPSNNRAEKKKARKRENRKRKRNNPVVYKKPQQPKQKRKRNKQHTKRDVRKHVLKSEDKPIKYKTMAHLLSQDEVNEFKKNGFAVVMVQSPVRKKIGNNEFVYWNNNKKIMPKGQSVKKPITCNVIIIAPYDHICDDQKIRFVGDSSLVKSEEKTWVLLCMVLQTGINPIAEQSKMDVSDYHHRCSKAKYNIASGANTSHHNTTGFIVGFGSRKEFSIDEKTDSSVKAFQTKKGMEAEAKVLEDTLIESMEYAKTQLHQAANRELLVENSAFVEACVTLAMEKGFGHDLHFKGKTRYTTMFYNVNASTQDKHTEMDWCMTTIYVPNQDWKNKRDDHLMFQFHITEAMNGVVKISMKPGTILYYHGYLLTHHQIHNHGRPMEKPCCLNCSAYANNRLLNHTVKSIIRNVDNESDEME